MKENDEYVEIKIRKSDINYLFKLLRNGYFKAEENYRKTEDKKPLNDIWKDTLEVNRRITKEVEKTDLI